MRRKVSTTPPRIFGPLSPAWHLRQGMETPDPKTALVHATRPRRSAMANSMIRYAQLRARHPERFVNTPGGIDILSDPDEIAAAIAAAGASPPESGLVHSDRYITVVRDPVRFPDGRLGLYTRILTTEDNTGVVILPMLRDAILLIEHFRHATRTWHLEAPRGFGVKGMDGRENAARELEEEIGARTVEIAPLGVLYADSGLLADHVALFTARIGDFGGLDTAEGIRRLVPMTSAEVRSAIGDGRINDGFTISAFTRAWLGGHLS
ncbi:NUDIX hydrolase [Kitasatospora hibisci]|uniref:NUDIX hydrolase n=1 Tax=Kitasatospora hibisci TaxID=3369522 RepID=UPI0037542A57